MSIMSNTINFNLLMATIGAVSYTLLKNKAFFIALFVLIVAYLWNFIMFYGEYGVLAGGLIASLWWGVIYAGLCMIGTVVAFLLHFAFKKEGF